MQQHGFNFTYQLECGSNGDLPSSGQVSIKTAQLEYLVALPFVLVKLVKLFHSSKDELLMNRKSKLLLIFVVLHLNISSDMC